MPTDPSILTTQIQTPLGALLAGATLEGICLLEFTDSGRVEPQLRRLEARLKAPAAPGQRPVFTRLQCQLAEYFAGQRRTFDLTLVMAGTAFQRRVWTGLQAIPYGEKRSYREFAAMLGCPNAARAVGHANAANPIAILVPCHRLVGSDGALTGYGGGLWRKERLLELEDPSLNQPSTGKRYFPGLPDSDLK